MKLNLGLSNVPNLLLCPESMMEECVPCVIILMLLANYEGKV